MVCVGGGGGGEGVADKLCAGQFYKLRNLQYLYIVL